MRFSNLCFMSLMAVLLIASFACKDKPVQKELEGHNEGEESGLRMNINETYELIRKGVRLTMDYDSESSSFIGDVENVTNETLPSVRVEVHLSNGMELGPSKAADLAPGFKKHVMLSAEGQTFEWWTAHAETGKDEHESGHEGDHRSEHGESHEHKAHSNEHGEH